MAPFSFEESIRISRCYDSHVHWLYSGEVPNRLNLSSWKNPNVEIKKIDPQPHHYRGKWLIGFGWNDHNWSEELELSFFDQAFPNTPVAFSRADGHALLVNSAGMELAGILNGQGELVSNLLEKFSGLSDGQIILDKKGRPTGRLVDRACDLVHQLIPDLSEKETEAALLMGQRRFHQFGVTHIRDLSCGESQWSQMVKLEEEQKLKLYVDQYISLMENHSFEKTLELALKARAFDLPHVRVQGVKIFYDGALGSKGALISGKYCGCGGHSGLQMVSDQELSEMLVKSWENNLDVAVHVIGDLAVENVLKICHGLWEKGKTGSLSLEHVELVNKKSLKLLAGRDIRCFMQPSHWLSDKKWLKSSLEISPDVMIFPWSEIEKHQVPIYFGSDSPIEPPDPMLTSKALEDASENGISLPGKAIWEYHSHPDFQWGSDCWSVFDGGKLSKVYFEGQVLEESLLT